MRAFVERATSLSLCAGTGAAVLYVAINRLIPYERPLSFALAFLKWSLLYYLAIFVPLLTVAWFSGRVLRRPWVVRLALLMLGGGFLLGILVLNRSALVQAFHLGGPVHFRILTPTALLLASGGLALGATLPLHRRWLSVALGIIAPMVAALAFLPGPVRKTSSAKPTATSLRLSSPRLALIGIDGADWTWMEPLMARGEMPNIAELRQRGAWGPLESLKPTASPALWTTVATGQSAFRHGIRDFTCLRVAGVRGVFRDTSPPRALGFERLLEHLRRTRRIDEGAVLSSARRSPALWEIASAEGSPIAVVGWWATWPAEPVLGAIVSERVHYYRQFERRMSPERGGLTNPEALYDEILPLVMAPNDVTFEMARSFMEVTPAEFEVMRRQPFRGKVIASEFKYLYSMFETDRRVALHLVERTRQQFGVPADLLVLFKIVDIASHASLRESELVGDHLGAPPEEVRRFGRVVSESYRAVDRAVGEIVKAFGPGTNVVVVSDHGFHVETDITGAIYHHRKAPPGIFVAAGPAFHPGPIAGLGLYDLLPMVAYLKGFPVADDLEGHVPERVFDPSFLANHRVRAVASYGRRGAVVTAPAEGGADEAVMERLRALGYVR